MFQKTNHVGMVESIQQDQKDFIRALHGGFCDYYTHKKRRLSLLYIDGKITQTLGAQNDEICAFSTILAMFCYVNQKVTTTSQTQKRWGVCDSPPGPWS